MQTADQLTTEFLNSYHSLHYNEQQVMQMLSLFITPVSRTTLSLCLQKAGTRINGYKNVTPQSLDPLLGKLRSLNLAGDVQGGLICQPLLLHPIMRELEKHKDIERFAGAFKEAVLTTSRYNTLYYKSFQHCLQDVRMAIYLKNESAVNERMEYCRSSFPADFSRSHPFALICPEPLDKEWLLSLPGGLLVKILTVLLDRALASMISSTAFDILETFIESEKEPSTAALYLYVSQLLLRGRIGDAHLLFGKAQFERHTEFDGWLALMRDDDEKAIGCFEQGLARIKRETGKRKIFYYDIIGLFYIVSLVRSGDPRHLQSAVELCEMVTKQREHPQISAIWMLYYLAQMRLGNNRFKRELEQVCQTEYQLGPISLLTHSLVCHWAKQVMIPLHAQQLKKIREGCKAAGFDWLAAQAVLLSKIINPQGKYDTAWADILFRNEGISSLSGNSGSGNDWERSLKALQLVGSSDVQAKEPVKKQSRLLWFLSGNEKHLGIQPVEQKQTAKGWTTGRNAAVKRLYEENAKLDFLTPQDRKIIACIRKERSYGYYAATTYEFDTIKAIRAMIDHPGL